MEYKKTKNLILVKSKINFKGFTLIELLIVIAVIGILAAGLLVLINPLEQIEKANDASRQSTINQLAKAVQAYYLSNGQYPTMGVPTKWIVDLVTAKEVQAVPSGPAGTTCSSTYSQGGWCFWKNGDTDSSNTMIWTKMLSQANKSKCTAPAVAFYRWEKANGTTCVVCSASELGQGLACQ